MCTDSVDNVRALCSLLHIFLLRNCLVLLLLTYVCMLYLSKMSYTYVLLYAEKKGNANIIKLNKISYMLLRYTYTYL